MKKKSVCNNMSTKLGWTAGYDGIWWQSSRQSCHKYWTIEHSNCSHQKQEARWMSEL